MFYVFTALVAVAYFGARNLVTSNLAVNCLWSWGWTNDKPSIESFLWNHRQAQADTQLEVQLALPVLFIKAEIEKEQGFTTVDVKTTDSELKKLEFQLPVTKLNLVETAIAQKLQLSPENVRRLVRYQISSGEE